MPKISLKVEHVISRDNWTVTVKKLYSEEKNLSALTKYIEAGPDGKPTFKEGNFRNFLAQQKRESLISCTGFTNAETGEDLKISSEDGTVNAEVQKAVYAYVESVPSALEEMEAFLGGEAVF